MDEQDHSVIPLRHEAVVMVDQLLEIGGEWRRIMTYWYDGEDFQFAIESSKPTSDKDAAKTRLCSAAATADLHLAFLYAVKLDTTRPH